MEAGPFDIEPAGEFLGYMAMEQSQRRTPRFPFSATAESIHAGDVDATRVTELSLYGCYLDVTTPLPRGTRVTVKIAARGQFFEATATVLYSQPVLGMGLGFREVKPLFQAVLQEWLRQSLHKQNTPPTITNFDSDKDR